MSRVLYISYDGMSDPLGQSQVLPYLRGLRERGHEIHLLSFEKPASFARAGEALKQSVKAAGIEWHPLKYHARPPVLSAVYDLQRMKRRALKLARLHSLDIVHCRGYLPAMAGRAVKRKTGARFIFDMRGFWPDERVDGGLWPQSRLLYRWIYRYFKKAEKKLLHEAAHIVSLTVAGKKIIEEELAPAAAVPVTVIPTCTDMRHFDFSLFGPAENEALRREAGIPAGALTIGYLGSTGTWYLTDEMLRFFRILRQKRRAVLLMITRDDPERLRKRATESGIPADEILIRPAGYREVPQWVSLFDFGLFFIKPGFSKQASSPTKMGEILAMGKPVICNAGVGDVAMLVNRFDAGIALESLDEKAFEEAVDRLDALKEKPAGHYRKAAAEWFSLERGIDFYDKIYRELPA